jgi:hypothetical protein
MAVKFYILQKVIFTITTYYLKTHYHKLHDFQDPFFMTLMLLSTYKSDASATVWVGAENQDAEGTSYKQWNKFTQNSKIIGQIVQPTFCSWEYQVS